MAEKHLVLVTGATGSQGGAVARHLLESGFRVRALTRKPGSDAAKALAKRGAEVVQGDLDDAASLERALVGAWGTFALQNTWEAGVEREEEQGHRFAKAARKAGVHHLVYSSVGSADWRTGIPHFDNKFRVEETVRALGFPSFTIVRPVFFMDNYLGGWYRPALLEGKLVMPLSPETPLQHIAVDDIGRFVQLSFQNPERYNRRAIDIAGDEQPMAKVAEILGQAWKRKIQYVQAPIAEVRKASPEAAAMYEWFEKVGYCVHFRALSGETGIRPVKLAEWAAQHPLS
jgi:uncharacterized protein YbjT (DUF2867 family)